METISISQEKKGSVGRIFSGTLLIAGTTIGAGMLGIPLVTAQSGFLPAASITILVWFFMLATGLLFLEVTLWMPEGANLLSMAQRFFGKKGRIFSAIMFVFLYYCLMTAYFAAGAPLLTSTLNQVFGLQIDGSSGYLIFAALFGSIVALGAKWIDRANIILIVAMTAAYAAMMGAGSSEVKGELLSFAHWPSALLALPVLFSAFGYHNVIPSLCTYLKRDRKSLRLSIILGTAISLLVYLLWQWLVIGSVSQAEIQAALEKGMPATQAFTGKPLVYLIGRYFAFFALVTSLLGVAFSMVDFIGDGFKKIKNRVFLVALTFVPPMLCAIIDPSIFDRALAVGGGIGEAILNGMIPVLLVWAGRYFHKIKAPYSLLGGKLTLTLLFLFSAFVLILELFLLIK